MTYEEYKAAGGKLEQTAFEAALPDAEALLREVTQGRIAEREWPEFAEEVARARVIAVEAAGAVASDQASRLSGAAPLKSFSNGVNTFGFASVDASRSTAKSAAVSAIVSALPVELCSACVAYNHVG